MLDAMDRLVLVDSETFGLNPQTDLILELGFMIIDLDFKIVDRWSMLVWDDSNYERRFQQLREDASAGDPEAGLVWAMHNESGLFLAAQMRGNPPEGVINSAVDFLQAHGVGKADPMVGSSVQFDRAMLESQMHGVFDPFSYRNIDTSSVKELCRRFNPDTYAELDRMTQPKKLHRVDPDLDDTANELRFYVKNFLRVDRG